MLIVKFLQIVLLLIFSSKSTVADKKTQPSKTTYIIQMDPSTMPSSFNDQLQWYASSLRSISDSAEMLYAYKHAIQGFSTRLTNEEAELLAKQPGVLSAIPETVYKLHTTRTPQFLGLEKGSTNYLPATEKESDVIIGVIDTGVWPELQSFNDAGLGPVPSRWKGECETEKDFNASSCNRKLVGARYFLKGREAAAGTINGTEESRSPRDTLGHGTHTSSTAGGSIVANASLFGYAFGKARGMATKARLAIYKACWEYGCFTTDVLAAIEKAIEDGVNIISISLGADHPTDYYEDVIAIGSFKAAAHGIFVSAAAGNGGPYPKSLSNMAPWITNVGAGAIDRDFPVYVRLGNGKNYTGASLYSGEPLPGYPLPLVYAGNVSSPPSALCDEHTLIPSKVKGKIVICEQGFINSVDTGFQVNKTGGLGMILINTKEDGEEIFAKAYLAPAASLGYKAGDELKKYALSDRNPRATLTFGGTKVHVQPSPVVAAFSSRGPNPLTPGILKPDLIAPGKNILAGWTHAAGPSELDYDTRRVSFNIISGTSMSCPHVSGLGAMLKGAHPDWSPATIRSALMTTAYTTDKNGAALLDFATGKPATPFDFGAGHVDPAAALDPGLVYDATTNDYLNFLCALDYTSSQIKQATGQDFTCDSRKKYRVEDLNYPSFAVNMKTASGSGKPMSVQHTRILTNVGEPGTYKVSVSSPSSSVKIEVEPTTLCFSKMYEKKSFTVTFNTWASMPSGTTTFGHLEWSDGKHKVVSPIALGWT
ncbi:subtilisin-like protease SBT1.7 [Neltuma alba]|uniref:subtilisin-like protease SBT1.7 n=1 Tax=Neltuma alba TaxID=207710 RepID=UPI0010A389B2|nr:subtilisin-like protease SBT1.7 [Prosopis alba]XP_028806930.1 subtilisin-like protease SBT1.7 [Prosopis alba]